MKRTQKRVFYAANAKAHVYLGGDRSRSLDWRDIAARAPEARLSRALALLEERR